MPIGPRVKALLLLAAALALPLACAAFLGAGSVSNAVAASALLAIAALAAALLAEKALRTLPDEPVARARPWLCLLIATLAFAAVGIRFTKAVGPRSGDEGHYIVLAESLFEDGDVDLKDFVDELGEERWARGGYGYYHITPRSRGGHLYSWHSFGLSLLMAPVVPLGAVGRHLVLGLIAALGCAGMFALCRSLGAQRTAAGIVVASFACSLLWVVYAARALPETLAAALVAWFAWSMAAWPRRPALAPVVGAACAAYLPWAHTRFLPIAAALAGLLVLRALSLRPRRLSSLALFLGLGLAGAAIFFAVQFAMFETGLPLPAAGLILSHPEGLWKALIGHRGLVASLPAALWMIAATLVWTVRAQDRFFPLAAVAVFLLNHVIASSTPFYEGGACLPGRYFVGVLPLLLPACAVLWPDVSRLAKVWFLFLSFASTGLLFLTLLQLGRLGKGFSLPATSLGKILGMDGPVPQPFVVDLRLDASNPVFQAQLVAALAGLALTLLVVACGCKRPEGP